MPKPTANSPQIFCVSLGNADRAQWIAAALEEIGFWSRYETDTEKTQIWVYAQQHHQPDLVLLDIPNQWQETSVELCKLFRFIRAGGTLVKRGHFPGWGAKVPIAMLVPREERDSIQAYFANQQVRPDALIHKPWTPFGLQEDLYALLRRTMQSEEAIQRRYLRHRSLVIDTEQKSVMVGTQRLNLTEREYAVLLYLMRYPGAVVSRENLWRDVWGYTGTPSYGWNDPNVHIKELRKHLKGTDCADVIKSEHGVGYRLLLETSDDDSDTTGTDSVLPPEFMGSSTIEVPYFVLVETNGAHVDASKEEYIREEFSVELLSHPHEAEPVCKIGRKHDLCDRVIRVGVISAHHASIFQKNGVYMIRDENSKHGTQIRRRINSEIRTWKVSNEEELRNNDEIIFARMIIYRFVLREEEV